MILDKTAWVTDPFVPRRTIFLYVPAGVFVEVRIKNVAMAELFDGTFTDGSVHHTVAPGMCSPFTYDGTTVPWKPATLVNVTV